MNQEGQTHYCAALRALRTLCCVAPLAFTPLNSVAQQAPPQTPRQKAPPKPAQKEAQPLKVVKKGPPRGPIEKLDCKIGTEENHARIAVLAQGGEVQSIAYYSKWKPRTCSIHLQRGDAYSKWSDTGDATIVTTEFGDVLVHEKKTEYHFIFREVDRMHYCGMMGKLNGSMTITRGPKRSCTVEGIMNRNEDEKVDGERAEEKPLPPSAQSAEVEKPQ